MSKFNSDDDRDLIAFLQQHRPIPPPAPLSSEEDLMMAIDLAESKQKTWKIKPLIGIASVAVAGSLLSWFGFHRALTPSYTNAQLESFMLDNWDRSVGDTSSVSFDYWFVEEAGEDRADNGEENSFEE